MESAARIRANNPLTAVSPAAQSARQEMVKTFDRDFETVSADDPGRRQQAYRLRYEVYCVDNAYEDPSRSVAGHETDTFDERAPHKLLLHRPSALAAGVVRLILPVNGRDHGLPVLRLTSGALARMLPAGRTAEVSRFAISRRFREQIRASSLAAGQDAGSVVLCHLSIGLMRGVVEMAAECGITHLCAMMEPALLRMLSRFGVHFEMFGPRIDHHGWRQPCFADLGELLARTWAERMEIWSILTDHGSIWPLRSGVEIRKTLSEPISAEPVRA